MSVLKDLIAKTYNQNSFRKTNLLFTHQTSIGHVASHSRVPFCYCSPPTGMRKASSQTGTQGYQTWDCCSGDPCQLQQGPKRCLRLCSPRSRPRDKGLNVSSYSDVLRRHSWGLGEVRQEEELIPRGSWS